MVSRTMDLHEFRGNTWCSRVPSTPTTKNYAGNEVSRPKSIPRKEFFFAEHVFSQYFPLFSIPQHLDFREFADLGMWVTPRGWSSKSTPLVHYLKKTRTFYRWARTLGLELFYGRESTGNGLLTWFAVSPMLRRSDRLQIVAENEHFACSDQSRP